MPNEYRLQGCGLPCTLDDCPPGLFMALNDDGTPSGHVGLKTQYGLTKLSDAGNGRVYANVSSETEAFVAASGEFWGAEGLVVPLSVEVVDAE